MAKREFHRRRDIVDGAIHTGYGERVVYLALSPDGRGLSNYGPVTLLLKEASAEDRCAALRENSYLFYKNCGLGPDVEEEPGWRSDWEDRSMLGVAKLEPELAAGMDNAGLAKLVLLAGDDRQKDRYIELHMLDALAREYVDSFYLDADCLRDRYETAVREGNRAGMIDRDQSGMTPEDREIWQQIGEALLRNGARLRPIGERDA